MNPSEKNQLLYEAKMAYENDKTLPAEKWIYDELIRLGMKFDEPFPNSIEAKAKEFKNKRGIKREFKQWQTDLLHKYKTKCSAELKNQYDSLYGGKESGEFITQFSNDEYRKMRYLLANHRKGITPQKVNMICAFHEYLRNNIDRHATTVDGKPNPHYYSCYKSIKQLVDEGFNRATIDVAVELLIDIGYLHKITTTKNGCNYYPLFRQTILEQ